MADLIQTHQPPERDGAWRGHTVVCLASGPSMTREDAEMVRAWRDDAPDARRVVVVNTTFRLAPWADALFAMDRTWWAAHWQEVGEVFTGRRYTINKLPVNWGVTALSRVNGFGNSGAAAISLAVNKGASRVVLLGYDCQHTRGETHWHGAHPAGLGNAATVARWPAKFEQLAKALKARAQIVNASRETALTCFERVELEDEVSVCVS